MEKMQLFLVSMDDEESRTLFMQRMLALIVLKVMSKRRILPPSAFRDTVIDGVECPMLSYKVDVCEALDFSITGANHALAKHYPNRWKHEEENRAIPLGLLQYSWQG
ncbi:unnamed protein product [Gongylonema pulchrum]|uniref:Bestrophin homolog n=1 Tax=Gongylonema pulchrum TaxID=637853 RepID=A0A183EVX6_9BILA|nr:unnamed protein product [Gongylonema pulchrum]